MLWQYICFGWRTNSGSQFNQNVSYLKGLFLNKALVKETELDASSANTVQSVLNKTGFMLRTSTMFFKYNEQIYLPDLYTYYIVIPRLFLIQMFTRQTLHPAWSSYQFLAREFHFLRRRDIQTFELLSHIVTCTSPRGSSEDENIST